MTDHEPPIPLNNAMTKAADTIHSWGMIHWVIFLFCFIQFLYYARLFIIALPGLGDAFSSGFITPLDFFLLCLKPVILLIAGALLLFRRKLATYLFGAYFIISALTIPPVDQKGWLISLLIVLAFLGFSMKQHKSGELR